MLREKIESKIKKVLPNSKVEVTNTSSEHIGHNASGAHIKVVVTDKSFKEMSLVDQHKKIYSILNDELKDNTLHALKIKTKTE